MTNTDLKALKEAAEELCDLVDDMVKGDHTPDSFTTQPLRTALDLMPGEVDVEALHSLIMRDLQEGPEEDCDIEDAYNLLNDRIDESIQRTLENYFSSLAGKVDGPDSVEVPRETLERLLVSGTDVVFSSLNNPGGYVSRQSYNALTLAIADITGKTLKQSVGAMRAGKPLLTASQSAQDSDPDLNKCPRCGGPADNGHDRLAPPNPYNCTKCEDEIQSLVSEGEGG